MSQPDGQIDQLDLEIIERLRRDALTTNKAIAQDLGVAESTIGSRIRSLTDHNIMRVVAVHDIRALGCDLLAHAELSIEGRDAFAIAEELARKDHLAMIALAAGAPQIILQINARDRTDLLDAVMEIGDVEGIADIRTTISLRILKFRSDYSVSFETGHADDLDGLDVEQRMLAIVEQDARRGNREIGRILGVSEAYVRKRLKSLIDSGALRFNAMIDPRAIGLRTSAIIRLSVAPGNLAAVGRAITAWDDVSYVSVTSGEFDMLTVVNVRDREELTRLANSRMACLPGVRRVDVREITEVLKSKFNVVRIAPTGLG